MKVNFMIIGAQKCGTTSLASILKKHPALVCCNTKEPKFFSQKTDGNLDFEHYHSMFKKQNDALYFEASTTYTFYPFEDFNIWDRIYDYNPEMKFIYLVRKPVDRIISSYMHIYSRGYTDYTLEEALLKIRFLIDVTRYYTQISPYIRKFGRNKILILDFREFTQNPIDTMYQVSKFLNLNSDVFEDEISSEHRNKSVGNFKKHYKYDSPSLLLKIIRKISPVAWEKITDNSERNFTSKPKLSNDYRIMINNLLELEIKALEKLMDKNLKDWL